MLKRLSLIPLFSSVIFGSTVTYSVTNRPGFSVVTSDFLTSVPPNGPGGFGWFFQPSELQSCSSGPRFCFLAELDGGPGSQVQARLVNVNPSEPFFPPFTVNYDVFPDADLAVPGTYRGLSGSILTISVGSDPATYRAAADPVSVSPEPSTLGLLLIPGALLLKLVQKRNSL